MSTQIQYFSDAELNQYDPYTDRNNYLSKQHFINGDMVYILPGEFIENYDYTDSSRWADQFRFYPRNNPKYNAWVKHQEKLHQLYIAQQKQK